MGRVVHGTTYLYRVFCSHGGLLYVGVTSDCEQRLRQHAASAPWWSDVDHVTAVRYRTRRAALRAERYVIEHDRPLHNITGQPLVPCDEELLVVVDPMLPGVRVIPRQVR